MKEKEYMTVEQWLGHDNQLGIDIWHRKYQRNGETFDEWVDRVSGGDRAVKELIASKKFLFGGRILSNRGLKGTKVTYSNCYVIAPPEDNIESIYDMEAWKQGLKGITIYRAGCMREGILTTDVDKLDDDVAVSEPETLPRGAIVECSNDLIGKKRKVVARRSRK